MPTLKTFLRERTPRAVGFARRVRTSWDRLRRGDGDLSVFRRIADENAWGDPTSVSGRGSNLVETTVIRREIPLLLDRLGAQSLLDAPCGDFHWMAETELGAVDYVGVDLVPSVIKDCRERHASPRRSFAVSDLLTDPLPRADVVLCRDCLVHLSYRHIHDAIANLKASGSTYLLTTTFPTHTRNLDIVTGRWRPVNLTLAPFGFPPPLETILEGSTEYKETADKSLALWRLADLPLPAGDPG